MIPPNAMQLVKDLHVQYVARTGYEIAYNMTRENMWRDWCAFGNWQWTPEDLARVIGYLRKKIAKGDRNEGALKFTNLIGDPMKFEEDLNLAREEARQVFGGRRRARVAPSPQAAPDAPETGKAAALRFRDLVLGKEGE